MLSRGRSFRTPQIRKVISHEHRDLTVFGQLAVDGESPQHRIGIRRTSGGETLAKIDGERKDRLSDLALMLPTVDVESSSFELVDGGPSVRRELLDWGLFHVEPSFFPVWQRYQRALKQRNAALKQIKSRGLSSVVAWDAELATAGESLHHFREDFLKSFQPVLQEIMTQFLGVRSFQLEYLSGWEEGTCLQDALSNSREKDQALGYTKPLFGIQRIETYAEHDRSHEALVYDAALASGTWEPSALAPGQRLTWSRPLYTKLETVVA